MRSTPPSPSCCRPRWCFAFGEPAEGLDGLRLSHRQALVAFPVALRGPERIVRYRDVALLAASLENDLLMTSLRRLYIDPLERERDGGRAVKDTLRAYFKAAHNISSAASVLGVNRHTVSARLRMVEKRFGRSIEDLGPDLEVALLLDDLEHLPFALPH